MSSLTPRDYSVVRPPRPRHCWTDNEMRILIRERARRNHEYWYNYPGRNKSQFWNFIASTVNSTCNSNYISTQCSNKFQSLKNEYYVSKRKYIHILYYSINNILIISTYFRTCVVFKPLMVKGEVGLALSFLIFLILIFESGLICIKNFLIETYKSNIILI